MRIAYIAGYQGSGLITQRAIRNRALATSTKVELIAQMLYSCGHEIEILSHGIVAEGKNRYYPMFIEPDLFNPDIPIYYSAALDIKRLNNIFARISTFHLLKKRNEQNPYDIIIIYNANPLEIKCAQYAMHRMRKPVILEYEDDSFLNISGATNTKLMKQRLKAQPFFENLSGCFAVSPHLLNQVPCEIPSLVLRGVVGDDLLELSSQTKTNKKNWVLFAGTHTKSKGIEELIKAWHTIDLPGWELHITGQGILTEKLKKIAGDSRSIIFHGLVRREELVQFMCSAKICINSHEISKNPGNVFAFKIIEYLAAGSHVITVPMGTFEIESEHGVTYISDNDPQTIALGIINVIKNKRYYNNSMEYINETYNTCVVSKSLNELINNASLLFYQKMMV